MSLIHIDIDKDVLDRVMALSEAQTETETVNLALRYYVERHEPIPPITRHFKRAQSWKATEDAERLHQAEKKIAASGFKADSAWP